MNTFDRDYKDAQRDRGQDPMDLQRRHEADVRVAWLFGFGMAMLIALAVWTVRG